MVFNHPRCKTKDIAIHVHTLQTLKTDMSYSLQVQAEVFCTRSMARSMAATRSTEAVTRSTEAITRSTRVTTIEKGC